MTDHTATDEPATPLDLVEQALSTSAARVAFAKAYRQQAHEAGASELDYRERELREQSQLHAALEAAHEVLVGLRGLTL